MNRQTNLLVLRVKNQEHYTKTNFIATRIKHDFEVQNVKFLEKIYFNWIELLNERYLSKILFKMKQGDWKGKFKVGRIANLYLLCSKPLILSRIQDNKKRFCACSYNYDQYFI